MTHNTFMNLKDWSKSDLELENGSLPLPSDETQIHIPTLVQGGGGWTPSPEFAVFRNDFTFSEKPLIFLTRWDIFYGWLCCRRNVTSTTMVATLAAILDFTKNKKSS